MLKFLFVTGSHKSGTSWLARMINANPTISLPDQELWLLGNPKSLGETINRAMDEWLALPTVSSQFKTEQRQRQARRTVMRAAIRGAIDAGIGGVKGAKVIGDKTPAFYAQQFRYLQSIFPDAYYVQIVRDPRDVVVSHHFHAYRLDEWSFFGDKDKAKAVGHRIKDGDNVGSDLLDSTSVARLLKAWKQVQTNGVDAADAFPNRHRLLRYEDLLVRPAYELKHIFDLVEQPLTDPQIDEIVARFSFENMSQGRKIGQEDPKSFFRKGGSGDWKTYFTPELDAQVREDASELMEHFGYGD
ncbi:MAG: sulfotransferase domain-containing protein [Pseudomonadota bacterium]